jgi:hypothetical protein
MIRTCTEVHQAPRSSLAGHPVPIPVFLANLQQCPCRQFRFTLTVITFRPVSVNLQLYLHTNGSCIRLSLLFRSVGHRVKTHKVTPAYYMWYNILKLCLSESPLVAGPFEQHSSGCTCQTGDRSVSSLGGSVVDTG